MREQDLGGHIGELGASAYQHEGVSSEEAHRLAVRLAEGSKELGQRELLRGPEAGEEGRRRATAQLDDVAVLRRHNAKRKDADSAKDEGGNKDGREGN